MNRLLSPKFMDFEEGKEIVAYATKSQAFRAGHLLIEP